jgi:hypothetical protein
MMAKVGTRSKLHRIAGWDAYLSTKPQKLFKSLAFIMKGILKIYQLFFFGC